MKNRNWTLKITESSENNKNIRAFAEKLSSEFGLGRIAALLLSSRIYLSGAADNELLASARAFLSPAISSLSSPLELPDMDKAVDTIRRAISENKKITVFGDYDVDGITSTASLYLVLKELGANADYYIPERESEGYGLTCAAIDTLHSSGTSLIITVDCGITSLAEAQHIADIGMSLIVTDHHNLLETLPNACAVVNPKRLENTHAAHDLSGAGVAFMLGCALLGTEFMLENHADVAAVGTVADVVPLTGDNRLIVYAGLNTLFSTKKKGLAALIDHCKLKPGPGLSTSISFSVCPKLNVCGRIGDPSDAVRLLTSDNDTEIEDILQSLAADTIKRQKLENDILINIEQNLDLKNKKIIMAYNENWCSGVIGIAASRLVDKYYLPAVVMTCDAGLIKGSARSVSGFHLFDNLSKTSELLTKYGGHELAAGMSLEKKDLTLFTENMERYASEAYALHPFEKSVEGDMEISVSDCTEATIRSVSALEPFGAGNPQPLFFIRALTIRNEKKLSGGKFSQFQLCKEKSINALYFKKLSDEEGFVPGCVVDVMCNLEISEFMGRKNVKLIIREMRKNPEHEQMRRSSSQIASDPQKFVDTVLSSSNCMGLTRDDCIPVYSTARAYSGRVTLAELFEKILDLYPNLSFAKTGICVCVLMELSLLRLNGNMIETPPSQEKKDVTSSRFFRLANAESI